MAISTDVDKGMLQHCQHRHILVEGSKALIFFFPFGFFLLFPFLSRLAP